MNSAFNHLKNRLGTFPVEPGCYLMKSQDGTVFYIGKAINLRSRIRSYFQGQDTRIFVQFLSEILHDIEVIVVRNNIEALLLEKTLIDQYQPRFNIQLKDDKNYILLRLAKSKKKSLKKRGVYPRLEIVRKARKDGARYFGPYPRAYSLRTTLSLINKYFQLRTCTDSVLENRTRPCLQYQMGRCPAPCVFDLPEYDHEVENVALFLQGNHSEIKKRLTAKMKLFARMESFEAAAQVRDQLQAVEESLTKQAVSEADQGRFQDIFGLARQGPHVAIVLINIRKGSWHNSRSFHFHDQPFPSDEILQTVMEQYYSHMDPQGMPDQILVPLSLGEEQKALEEMLFEKTQRHIEIKHAVRGKNLALLEIAQKNAQTLLSEALEKHQSEEESLEALQKFLKLARPPIRMECIDISLFQGTDAVGSCVAFAHGKPDKSGYRAFNIKTVSGTDDFSMIQEVVDRRIKAGLKDRNLPDLLLIDGGKGQLNAALKACQNNGIKIGHGGLYLSAIAKARTLSTKEHLERSDERIFLPFHKEPLILKAHTLERYLVERIRDEAHRFAITTHRKKRKRRTLNSTIRSIPGIGKKRQLDLLRHFLSVENLKKASPEEIAQVPGIGKKIAQQIFDALKST